MKKIIILGAIIVIAIIIFLIAGSQFGNLYGRKSQQSFYDEKNSTFVIDDQTITLKNGKAVIETEPRSTYRYFGNSSSGDLNGDKIPDIAFLVTAETGGTGLFYYLVVATQNNSGYEALTPFFIGDRIAPQSTNIGSGILIVNYADRGKDEPFSTKPSFGKSLIFVVTKDNKLEQVITTNE